VLFALKQIVAIPGHAGYPETVVALGRDRAGGVRAVEEVVDMPVAVVDTVLVRSGCA
jgi:hypothetical protein